MVKFAVLIIAAVALPCFADGHNDASAEGAVRQAAAQSFPQVSGAAKALASPDPNAGAEQLQNNRQDANIPALSSDIANKALEPFPNTFTSAAQALADPNNTSLPQDNTDFNAFIDMLMLKIKSLPNKLRNAVMQPNPAPPAPGGKAQTAAAPVKTNSGSPVPETKTGTGEDSPAPDETVPENTADGGTPKAAPLPASADSIAPANISATPVQSGSFKSFKH
jgi:DNA polymerase III gamma/tau subunit